MNIDYPKLFIEANEEITTSNETEAESYMCEDLRHRCRWHQVEYDVSEIK